MNDQRPTTGAETFECPIRPVSAGLAPLSHVLLTVLASIIAAWLLLSARPAVAPDDWQFARDRAAVRAAFRIQVLIRFGSTDWQRAIVLYHSASLMRGAWYLERVQAARPAARAGLLALDPPGPRLPQCAVPLSAEGRLVRIVTAADPIASPPAGLSRVVSPPDVPARGFFRGGTL